MIRTLSSKIFPVPGTDEQVVHIYSWTEQPKGRTYIYYLYRRDNKRYIEEFTDDGLIIKIEDDLLWRELNERANLLGLQFLIVPPLGTQIQPLKQVQEELGDG